MEQIIEPSHQVRRIQRRTLIILIICAAISTIDRAALAVANPLIRKDLGLSVADMGLLLSAFLWAYAFTQLPIGPLVDRFGPRRVLALGMALWSAAQLACGMVSSAAQLAFARAMLGVGEAPQFPSGAQVIRSWFALPDRGRATGYFLCASYLGTGLAVPLITTLMLSFGWRWMFICLGIAGLIMAVIWALVYRKPQRLSLSAADQSYLGVGSKQEASPRFSLRAWLRLFKKRITWGLVLGYMGVIYVNWLFNSWLPGYLHMQRHMSLVKVGWAAAIPYVCAVLGAIASGYVVDFLMKRGVSVTSSRKIPSCVFLFVQALMVVLAVNSHSGMSAVACLSGAMFCGTAATSIAWAMVSAFAPADSTATIGSLQNCGGYIGGASAPIVTGFIVQASGSFNMALYIGAGMSLFSALVYLLLVRERYAGLEQRDAASVAS